MFRYLWVLLLSLTVRAEGFYQTAFIVEKAYPDLSWSSMGLPEGILKKAVEVLTGESFTNKPVEWWDYFKTDSFEDENPQCLRASGNWYLVSFRIIPLAAGEDFLSPQIRLNFQAFCENLEMSSDTSLQVVVNNLPSKDLKILLPHYPLTELKSSAANMGFVNLEDFKHHPEWPELVTYDATSKWSRAIKQLLDGGGKIESVKWMASLKGQLDWVFGELVPLKNNWQPRPIQLTNPKGTVLIDLGYFDFLPLSLREVFNSLNPESQKQLAQLHVMEDLHDSPMTAEKVLNKDFLTADPHKISHKNVSCIQCHSSQERIIRNLDYLNNGSVREFGYFFRGLGLIANQPYVSWRSVQESLYLSEKLNQSELAAVKGSLSSSATNR